MYGSAIGRGLWGLTESENKCNANAARLRRRQEFYDQLIADAQSPDAKVRNAALDGALRRLQMSAADAQAGRLY